MQIDFLLKYLFLFIDIYSSFFSPSCVLSYAYREACSQFHPDNLWVLSAYCQRACLYVLLNFTSAHTHSSNSGLAKLHSSSLFQVCKDLCNLFFHCLTVNNQRKQTKLNCAGNALAVATETAIPCKYLTALLFIICFQDSLNCWNKTVILRSQCCTLTVWRRWLKHFLNEFTSWRK